MAIFKRIAAFFLSGVIVLSMIPVVTQAQGEQTAFVENEGMTVEGTTGMGSLLSREILNYNEEIGDSAAYNVVGLTVAGSVATAEFCTSEPAYLIVGIYTEDGKQLQASGYAPVEPGQKQTDVTLTGTMPQYFLATAYLVDVYDYSPLCSVYRSVLYTKEMQTLLSSTVENYGDRQVFNLDNDSSTNFAVYADSVTVLPQSEGVNVVTGADYDRFTYTIKNPDASVTGLKKGQIFSLPCGDYDALIVKVDSVVVNGDTATVYGQEVALEEVFTYVKVEIGPSKKPATKDAGEYHQTWSDSIEADLGDLKIEVESGHFEGSMGWGGTVSFGVAVELTCLITPAKRFVEFKTTYDFDLTASAEGKFKIKIPLGEFNLRAYGIGVGFEPKVVVEFNGEVSLTLGITGVVGFSYENGIGFKNLSTEPEPDPDFKVEASLFVGVDMCPQVEIAEGLIADLELSMPIGLQLDAQVVGKNFEKNEPEGPYTHNCDQCVDMQLKFKAEFTGEAQFLNCEKLKVKSTAISIEITLMDMYWSMDHEEFGIGKCPHMSYRTTVHVAGENKPHAGQAEVTAHWAEEFVRVEMGKTNNNGVVISYLQPGTYTFETFVDGRFLERVVVIENQPVKVELDQSCVVSELSVKFSDKVIQAEKVRDTTIDSFGTLGPHVGWILDGDGTLTVYGNGEMNILYGNLSDATREKIYKIVICDGVTSISMAAFYRCTKLETVEIADSVTNIEAAAFRGCTSLDYIRLPEHLAVIRMNTFEGCTSLKTVIIYDHVRLIEDYAFMNCTAMETILLPESLTTLNHEVFAGCTSLRSVTLPNSVTSVGQSVFAGCTQLRDVELSASMETVEIYMFKNCASLTSITIPESVNDISMGAFENSGLKEIHIPGTVTRVSTSAFKNCAALSKVELSGGLEHIGNYAFQYCTALNTVTIPASVTVMGDSFGGSGLNTIIFEGPAPSIGTFCFGSVTATAYYPEGDASWNGNVKGSYWGNITWVGYDKSVGFEPEQTAAVTEQEPSTKQKPATRAIYGGEYGTEVKENQIIKSASFSGLVPGANYLLLALVDPDAEDPLAAENILAIDQAAAADDGTLVFVYKQRVKTATASVVACGASNRRLENAQIQFPLMFQSQEQSAVKPTVQYDGRVLTEGIDYTLFGTVDYTQAGTYICYIRGINNYAGLVQCTYTVVNVSGSGTEEYDYLKLHEDTCLSWSLKKDLYIDLNGYAFTGTLDTNGFRVYGMDSSTDGYTCDSMGSFACVDGEGVRVVPEAYVCTEVSGAARRYVTIAADDGFTFHRIYVGITHQTLKPTKGGFGFKAVFYGDTMVQECVDRFGYSLQMGDHTPVTVSKDGADFVSGETLSLRVDRVDVENYGETPLQAQVFMTINDVTVSSAACQVSVRQIAETVNANASAYTQEQLSALKAWLSKFEATSAWDLSNI